MEEALLRHLWEASIGAGIMIILLLLLRRIFRARVRARLIYTAWLLVVIRLLLPVQIKSPVSVFHVLESLPDQAIVQQVDSASQPVQSSEISAPAVKLPDVLPQSQPPAEMRPSAPKADAAPLAPEDTQKSRFMFAPITQVWLTGAALMALYILFVNARFYRRANRSRLCWLNAEQTLLYRAQCERLGVKPLPVQVVERIPSPCLIGTLRPSIALTPRSAREDCLPYVLLHELSHYQQHDHLWALLRSVCVVLFWFHPLVWVAAHASRSDCELSCDEQVLKKLSKQQHHTYAHVLIHLIQTRPALLDMAAVQGATSMAAGKKAMKERISRIVIRPRILWAASVGVLLLMISVGCVTLGARQNPAKGAMPSADGHTPSPTASATVEQTPTPEPTPMPTPSAQEEILQRLGSYAATIEALFPDTVFEPMSETELQQAMDGLPEPVKSRYAGIGRKSDRGGSYVLMTAKPGVERLPETAYTYTVSPAGTMLEEVHVVNRGDEITGEGETPICVMPLGMRFEYNAQSDIATLYPGTSDGQEQAAYWPLYNAVRVAVAGDQAYLDYLHDARRRGVEVWEAPREPYVKVSMMLDGVWREEYIPLEADAATSLQKYHNLLNYQDVAPDLYYTPIGITIQPSAEPETAFWLCLTPEGGIGVRNGFKQVAPITTQLYKTLVDLVRTKTAWMYVDQKEIHDLVKAQLRIRLNWDQPEQTQTIDEPKLLAELEALLQGAKATDVGGCPYTGSLLLTRKDGETINVQVATDSCDGMILGTSTGYDYGPELRKDGEGTENKQHVLIRIFDQVSWER